MTLTKDQQQLRKIRGQLIRKCRCMLDIKAVDMASLLNISPQQYCDIERGYELVKESTVKEVKNIYNQRIDDVIVELQNLIKQIESLKEIIKQIS